MGREVNEEIILKDIEDILQMMIEKHKIDNRIYLRLKKIYQEATEDEQHV